MVIFQNSAWNKFQYLVWCPRASITAWHRLGMLVISRLICNCKILFHSSCKAGQSSRTVTGCTGWQDMALWSMSQTCSIGLRSGGLAGQGKTSIVSLARYWLVRRAVCGRALSCMRIKSGPTAPAYGRTWTSKISRQYLLLLRYRYQQYGVQFCHSNLFLPIPWQTLHYICHVQRCKQVQNVHLVFSALRHVYLQSLNKI